MRDYLFYRRETLKTTWTFRLLLLLGVGLLATITRGWWIPATARSLICNEGPPGASDAILVENYDTEYLLFETAGLLRKQGLASRILVAVPASWDSPAPNLVSKEIVGVMARVAQLPPPEIITVRATEPLTLSVTTQVRDYLRAQGLRSVIVVSSGFRSRRSSEVNERVFDQSGIRSTCVPVFGPSTVSNWADSWHGIQGVALELMKLQYYRFYVLPFRAPSQLSSRPE